MSQKCERLHEILKEGKKFRADPFKDENVKKELKCHGLYIFYEEGETGHGGDRIVRVGRAISEKNTIYLRNSNHFATKPHYTKDNSIFRKQIGRAILCDKPERLNNWNIKREKKGYIPDRETEEKVSEHLKKCYFVAIAIEDRKKIEELEKKMTVTVAQCNECKPSENWLGKKSPQGRIRQYGLWQELNLQGGELSDDDLDEIEKYLIKA